MLCIAQNYEGWPNDEKLPIERKNLFKTVWSYNCAKAGNRKKENANELDV